MKCLRFCRALLKEGTRLPIGVKVEKRGDLVNLISGANQQTISIDHGLWSLRYVRI